MSYINILNFSITGDCTNSGLGEIYLEITGDSPTWVVSEDPIVTGYLPTSGLTSGNNIYYVQGLSAGTYTLKIQDTVITPGDGYYIFLPFFLSSGTTVDVDAYGTTCGADNGSITANTGNNFGSSTYFLFDNNDNYITSGVPNVGESYLIFPPTLSADTYYVIADDGGGCTGKSASVIIYSSSSFDYGYYVVDDSSCIFGEFSGKIFLTGLTIPTSVYTIDWLSNVNGQTGTTITGLTQGTYTVNVTDSLGCVVSKSIQVNKVPTVGVGAIYTVPPDCFQNNGEVTVVVTGGTAPYYYSGSNGVSQFVFTSFSSQYTFTGLPAGVFYVEVTDAGLCKTTGSVNLVTPNSFGTVSIVTTNSLCNSNNGTVNVTINNGVGAGSYNFILSGSNGTYQTISQEVLTNTFTAPSGDYLIFIDNGTGCIYTGTTSLFNQDKFPVTAQTVDTSCGLNNGSLNVLTSTGFTIPLSYQIINSTTSQSITQASGNFFGLTPGNYLLNVTDGDGCQQSQGFYIAPSNNVYFDFLSFPPVLGNDGEIDVLITSGEPPFTLLWSPNVGAQSGLTVTGLSSGDYTLTVIDDNGCSLTKNIKLFGTQLVSSYTTFSVCEQQNFVDIGLVGLRGIKQMFNEGFYDLTSGDTGCTVVNASFELQVNVGGVEIDEIFYSSSGLTDYPSDIVFTNSLIDILDRYVGVGLVTVDLVDNRITITNDCEEIQRNCRIETYNLLNDTRFIVNLAIRYDILCEECN